MECDGASATGADPRRVHPVGDRGEGHGGRRARCAQGPPAHHPGRATHGAAGHAGAGGRQLQSGCEPASGRHPRPGWPQDVAAAQAGRRPAGRARLVGPLPLCLPGAKDQQGRGPARRRAVADRGGAVAHLPRQRRPGQLLPTA